MSNLQDLVPPLELCKRIPEGAFTNSVFVWSYSCDKRKTEPFLDERDCIEFCRRDMVNAPPVYPAPTLTEIMKELPTEKDGYFLVLLDCRNVKKDFQIGYAHLVDGNFVTHPYFKEKDANPATAALKLWLELNKEEEEK